MVPIMVEEGHCLKSVCNVKLLGEVFFSEASPETCSLNDFLEESI